MRVGAQIAEGVRLHDPTAEPLRRTRELLEFVRLSERVQAALSRRASRAACASA